MNLPCYRGGDVYDIAVGPEGDAFFVLGYRVVRFDPNNEEIVYSIDLSRDASELSQITLGNDNFYVDGGAASSDKITAYDIETGDKQWAYSTGTIYDVANMIFDGERVYFDIGGSNGSLIYALSTNGEKKWSRPVPTFKLKNGRTVSGIPNRLRAGKDRLYFGYDSYAFGLNKKTGKETWRVQADDLIDQNMYKTDVYTRDITIGDDGTIYTYYAEFENTPESSVRAYTLDGTEKWSRTFNWNKLHVDYMSVTPNGNLYLLAPNYNTYNFHNKFMEISSNSILQSGWPVENGNTGAQNRSGGVIGSTGGGGSQNEKPTLSKLTVEQKTLKAKISDSTPVIEWAYSDPNGDKQSAYQVQLARTNDFADIKRDSGKVKNSKTSWSGSPNLVNSGDWFVRVRAWDSKDAKSDWVSGSFFFNQNPEVPIDLKANGTVLNTTVLDTAPTISWTHNDPNNDKQHKVELQIAELGRFSTPSRLYEKETSKQTWGVNPGHTRDGRYHVRIRTQDKYSFPSGYGPFSSSSLYYNLDREAFTVQAIKADPANFNPSAGESTDISYVLSETAYMTAKVYDNKGNLIKTLTNDTLQWAGSKALTWNGKDADGNIVGNGQYTIRASGYDAAVGDQDTEEVTVRVISRGGNNGGNKGGNGNGNGPPSSTPPSFSNGGGQ